MSDWLEAEQRIERAHQLSESFRWEEALAEVDAALRIDPRNPDWHSHRGFILDQLFRSEEAIKSYRASLRFRPNERDVMMALGLNLIRTGRHAKAAETLSKVIENWPDFEPGYCYSILAYAELGDFERAEQYFYLAQQMTEECPHCYNHIAWAKFKQQDHRRAIFAWNKALDLMRDYPGARQHIADCHRAMGQIVEAREHYLQALREDPGNTDLLKDLGDMLVEAGQLDGAAEKYRLITELEPDYASAYAALGHIALIQGRPEEAAEQLRTALRHEPTYPGLHTKLGEALLRQGRLQEAKRHLSVELERNPDDLQALMTMGNCLLEMGRPTAASHCFRRLANLQSDAPGPHHNLAVCCFINGRFEQGIRHCEEALELRPDYVMAMHKLALACLHTGCVMRAATIIHRALEIEPQNPAIRQLQKRLRWYRLGGYLRSCLRPVRWALECLRARARP